MRSAVFLIFTILSIAGIYFILYAEFLGAIQILVYAGGIMVIYLFIIFLVKLEVVEEKKRPFYIPALSVLLLIILGAEVVYLLIKGHSELPLTAPLENLNLKSLSNELLKTYLIPFELASLLLIGALVGAIYLARRKRE